MTPIQPNIPVNKDEMVILTQTYDLLMWVLPRSMKFPKSQRFVLTQRLQNALLDFQECLFLANAHAGQERLQHLRNADAHLNKLRLYLRISHQSTWLTPAQFEHVSKLVAEVGRLLGGWLRQTRGRV